MGTVTNDVTCPRCRTTNDFYVVESGPHLKAMCNHCDKYIKFVPKGFMKYIDVESSTIEEIGYDGLSKMEIRFKGNRHYMYVGVPPQVYAALMAAPSKGKHYAQFIKGKYLTALAPDIQYMNMADKIIKMSIDVTKLKKEWFFKGEKGTYANVTLLFNENQDAYGNNGMIVQDVPKAEYEKDKTLRGPILGNGKVFGATASNEGKPGQEVGQMGGAVEEDLPF